MASDLPGWDPQALVRARERRGWTQADLAGRIGARQEHVSDWERGVHAPTATTLGRLIAVVGPGLVRRDSLAALRVAKGWTQVDLARVSGISKGLIAAMETGERPVTEANAVRLAECLGGSPERVLRLSRKAQRERG